ncbi:MAG: helix-turn-helix domain-containing protein [Clostridia bacterium]|nr:helix-turn-helix domain-containing protein [Clostridia bacterium]
MDMQKIGNFLAELRKSKNLTQDELGEQIGVTNKTVSRWENGNYLPPVEMLQMLSKLYDVSINELLSGARLNDERYKEKAEEYIAVDLMKKSKEAKKRLIISIIVACITILAGTAIILLPALLSAPIWLRIICIALSAVIIGLGIGVCCVLTIDAGVYECPNCGEKFVPSMKDFILGPHTFTKRKLKCPKCGKKSYCKKRLNKI